MTDENELGGADDPPNLSRFVVAQAEAYEQALAAAESVSANKSVRRLLVHGCVGVGAGAEFMTFLDTQSLPDPEDALSDPNILVLPRRGDLAVAIVPLGTGPRRIQ